MSGYFVVHRDVFAHVDFADEPFTEREAWMWLISEAAWQPKRVRVGSGSGTVELERGELAHSLRFLAEKWKWSVKRVRGYLDRGEQSGRLTRKRAHDGAVITICNYDKYQLGGHTEGQPEGTRRAHEGHKEEELKKVITEIDTREVAEVHREFLKVARSDGDTQSLWGSQHQIDALLHRGFPRATILAGAARAMQGRAQPPPWSYFAKCIESENEQRSAPAKKEINNGTTGNVLAAADKLVERMRQFDEPSGVRSGEGATVVRLLPEGGRERP